MRDDADQTPQDQSDPLMADSEQWASTIVGLEWADPADLLAHPDNWRIHSRQQGDAFVGSVAEIGWWDAIKVSKRTGRVLNGHLRSLRALQAAQKRVPILVLDVDENQERRILLEHDTLAAYAGTDRTKLRQLLDDTTLPDFADPALKAVFADLDKEARKALFLPDDEPTLGSDERVAAKTTTVEVPEPERTSGRGNVVLDERPQDTARFALSIVLDREQHQRWQVVKKQLQLRTDTEAFLSLLDSMTDAPLDEE